MEEKQLANAGLRGVLHDIALALECRCCFEKLGEGSVSFGCGHTDCNRPNCASRFVDACPECRLPVISRVQLFGALPDVGVLLEKEPAVPDDVEQVQRSEELQFHVELTSSAEDERVRLEAELVQMRHERARLEAELVQMHNQVWTDGGEGRGGGGSAAKEEHSFLASRRARDEEEARFKAEGRDRERQQEEREEEARGRREEEEDRL
jgi:hypothetical protein